jgi:ABC-type antimicrobial peptide transport system permease subunit
VGVGLGIAATVGAARLESGLLFEVRPLDPPTIGAAALAFAAVALGAAYLPARVAARVDPMETLREE